MRVRKKQTESKEEKLAERGIVMQKESQTTLERERDKACKRVRKRQKDKKERVRKGRKDSEKLK